MQQTLSITRNVTMMQRCNLKRSIYTINRNEVGIYYIGAGIASVNIRCAGRRFVAMHQRLEQQPVDILPFKANGIFRDYRTKF